MNSMTCSHQNHKEIARFGAEELLKCDRCELIFTASIAKQTRPEFLYEDYYKNEMASRFNPGIECLIRLFRFFRAFKVFTISPGPKSILDVGSGRGLMLYYLKKYYGYTRAAGIQISKNAVEFSRNKLGLKIYDRDLLELSFGQEKFDVITIWHVLEHLPKPEKYIEKIYDLLNNNGKLVIEVPNFESWTRRLTGKYWLGLDLEYHMHFFAPGSLQRLLQKYRFKVICTHTFSMEYSTFISTQSLVSLLTGSNHILFKFLQGKKGGWRLVLHIALFTLLAPACFLINILLYFSKRGEILLVVAEKNTW